MNEARRSVHGHGESRRRTFGEEMRMGVDRFLGGKYKMRKAMSGMWKNQRERGPIGDEGERKY